MHRSVAVAAAGRSRLWSLLPQRGGRTLRPAAIFVPTALMGCVFSLLSSDKLSFVQPNPARLTHAAGAHEPLIGRQAQTESSSSGGAIEVKAKPGAGKKILVLGGNGFVGREVCKVAVERGYEVISLSRRGENPEPANPLLTQVKWVKGNAVDSATVSGLVNEVDAVVHAIGLLFDVNSGLTNLNLVVSGSKSFPDADSTYDVVTRKTAFNLISAVKNRLRMPFSPPTPVLFVSAAEAGWPDVKWGPEVEQKFAPSWLKEYLIAKRAVEAEIQSSPDQIRAVIFRPSLIWSWTKFDVLPAIPIFNLANALGVPFVDKTVTVRTLSRAIISALENDGITGVQRYMQMESLEKSLS